MKRFLNVVPICLVTSLLVIPVFTLFNTECLADGVRLKDKYPPSWYQILPAGKRFVLVMNKEAVLDKETGLVWETSPSIEIIGRLEDAIEYAYDKITANRKGWRLPTIEELSSLIDPTQKNPSLPQGHPFRNVQSGVYRSSDTSGHPGTTTYREWSIDFSDGHLTDIGNLEVYTWCVRGK